MTHTPESDPMQEMQNFLANMGRAIFDEPAMCTSWVLVCEWSNGKEYWTSTVTDEDSPPWRHMGLLTYAAENLSTEYEENDDESESELD